MDHTSTLLHSSCHFFSHWNRTTFRITSVERVPVSGDVFGPANNGMGAKSKRESIKLKSPSPTLPFLCTTCLHFTVNLEKANCQISPCIFILWSHPHRSRSSLLIQPDLQHAGLHRFIEEPKETGILGGKLPSTQGEIKYISAHLH